MPYASRHPTKSGRCPRCAGSHSVSAHKHHGTDSFQAVRGGTKTPTYKAWQKKYTRKGKAPSKTTGRTTTKRRTTAKRKTRR